MTPTQTAEFETLLSFFKALGNESRLKIIGILANREASVEELATLLNLKEPTISHHLTTLKQENLVAMRAEGNTHLYRFQADRLLALNKELLTTENIVSLANDIDCTRWERKVLDTFFSGNQLQALPSAYKKKLVIYKWFLNLFEHDRQYPEKELNHIIYQHFADYATIRRAFIDLGWMTRANGIYQRTEVKPVISGKPES